METTRETTEHIVTDDPPPIPAEPVTPRTEPAGEPAASPTDAAVEAVAIGVAIGEQVGAATVAADQATAELATWRNRAETAERERQALQDRITALETPPVAPVEAELVTVEEPAADDPSATPVRPRGLFMRMFLG